MEIPDENARSHSRFEFCRTALEHRERRRQQLANKLYSTEAGLACAGAFPFLEPVRKIPMMAHYYWRFLSSSRSLLPRSAKYSACSNREACYSPPFVRSISTFFSACATAFGRTPKKCFGTVRETYGAARRV